MELESMTALELAAKIRQREVSVLDGVKEVFDQIESKEDKCMHILIRIKRSICTCKRSRKRNSGWNIYRTAGRCSDCGEG